MNQADIETFLMLVQTRNITKTAENLFVSQPTISHRLKLLEEELQVPLLIRKKGYKKIELTPKGEEFLPIAERWLALMRETQQLQISGNEMNLNIGCTNTLNSCIFNKVYRIIRNDPELNLQLNITTHYSQSLYERLENRTIDVGFVYHHLHYKNIIVEPVLKEKMYLVQELSHAVRKTCVSLDELDPDKEVFFSWESSFQIWHDQIKNERIVSGTKRNTLQVDIYSLLAEFMKDEGSWVICPVTVANCLKSEGNVFVSEMDTKIQPPERITYMIRNADISEAKQKALAVFEAKVKDYFVNSGLDHYMDRYTLEL